MSEPLFWNPLSDCAVWLSKRTGREMDARAVVDLVAQMGKQGDPKPTIIGVPLPRERGIVRVMMVGHPEWDNPQTEVEHCTVQMTEQRFGPPPGIFRYLEQVYPTFQFLCVSNLMQLLIYGRFELVFVGDQRGNPHEMAVIMPWNEAYPVTIEACGIKRNDLLALGERLAPSLPLVTIQPAPANKPVTPAAVLAAPPAEVPLLRQQERKILEWLKANGHDAQSLPKRKNGHGTVKTIAKAALDGLAPFEGITTFKKTWDRLREGKEIQEVQE